MANVRGDSHWSRAASRELGPVATRVVDTHYPNIERGLNIQDSQPLTATEREQLFRAFTAWYHEAGHGMSLGDSTRTL